MSGPGRGYRGDAVMTPEDFEECAKVGTDLHQCAYMNFHGYGYRQVTSVFDLNVGPTHSDCRRGSFRNVARADSLHHFVLVD